MATTLIIPRKVHLKVQHLLKKFPDTEWSGVAFYQKVEPDKSGWSDTWRIKDFYPIDLGGSASTEFDGEQLLDMQCKAYEDNKETKECLKGLIHSHHGLSGGAYISSVDNKHLEEAANDIGYPSFVVAHPETGSPFAFAVSYTNQYGRLMLVTDYKKACFIMEHNDKYTPSGLFKECVESLEKQEEESKKKVTVVNNYYNANRNFGRQSQTALFDIGQYIQESTSIFPEIPDDLEYTELKEKYDKAITKVTSVSVHHPKFEKYDRMADNAEKALDDYMGMNNIEYQDADTGKVV